MHLSKLLVLAVASMQVAATPVPEQHNTVVVEIQGRPKMGKGCVVPLPANITQAMSVASAGEKADNTTGNDEPRCLGPQCEGDEDKDDKESNEAAASEPHVPAPILEHPVHEPPVKRDNDTLFSFKESFVPVANYSMHAWRGKLPLLDPDGNITTHYPNGTRINNTIIDGIPISLMHFRPQIVNNFHLNATHLQGHVFPQPVHTWGNGTIIVSSAKSRPSTIKRVKRPAIFLPLSSTEN